MNVETQICIFYNSKFQIYCLKTKFAVGGGTFEPVAHESKQLHMGHVDFKN